MMLRKKTGLVIAFLTAMSLVSLAFTSSPSQPSIYSGGQIEYASQKDPAPLFGWGGYITNISDIIPILNNLKSGGYSAIRYWALPKWYYGQTPDTLNFTILDYLVQQAAAENIVVYIDCEHNYPPSAYISGNVSSWINDLINVGSRYENASNVVLECVNEYTGNDQPVIYNEAISALRTAGIHLPLLFNFWWNQPNVALNDPDNNYAIGRHLYGSGYDSYNPTTPMNLSDAVDDSGINSTMYKYFDDPTQNLYLQSVLNLHIPNGWVITELGPTDNESQVSNPSVGNMAFAMQFLREAASHNVTVICYRIGDLSEKALYEQKAQQFFQEDFFTPPA